MIVTETLKTIDQVYDHIKKLDPVKSADLEKAFIFYNIYKDVFEITPQYTSDYQYIKVIRYGGGKKLYFPFDNVEDFKHSFFVNIQSTQQDYKDLSDCLIKKIDQML